MAAKVPVLARPEAFDVTVIVFDGPVNTADAPAAGAVKTTLTPCTATLLAFLTMATSGLPKFAPVAALWPSPLEMVMVAGASSSVMAIVRAVMPVAMAFPVPVNPRTIVSSAPGSYRLSLMIA